MLNVQAAERALCAHLNALAGHLLADVLESETPQARSKRLKQVQRQATSSGKEPASAEDGGEQPDQRRGSAIDNWRRLSTAKGKKKQGKQELPQQETTGVLRGLYRLLLVNQSCCCDGPASMISAETGRRAVCIPG